MLRCHTDQRTLYLIRVLLHGQTKMGIHAHSSHPQPLPCDVNVLALSLRPPPPTLNTARRGRC